LKSLSILYYYLLLLKALTQSTRNALHNDPPKNKHPQKGFNAIRLPFIFRDLRAPATQIGGYCTGAHTLEELAARTVDPEHKGAVAKRAPPPVVPLPAIKAPGECNKYIPGGHTIDRYVWTVQWLVANGW
jgi:hypothetical protein